MGGVRGSEGRGRKTCRDACDHHGPGKNLVPPEQERHDAKHGGGDDRNRQYWLTIGGKVEGNPGSEGDRDPRQQPPGARLCAHPFAQFVERTGPDIKPGRKAASLRLAARRPSPRNTLCPARRSAIQPPYATPAEAMLPRAVARLKANRYRIVRKPQLSSRPHALRPRG